MKKILIILALLFATNSFAQLNNNIRPYFITGGATDSVLTYRIGDVWMYDDHAFVIMADTLSGFAKSGGVVPTYTFTVKPIASVGISGRDSLFTLYNNGTTSSAQTITTASTPVDSARIYTITPTVIPPNALEFTVSVTGIPPGAQWRLYLGYIGRKDREE